VSLSKTGLENADCAKVSKGAKTLPAKAIPAVFKMDLRFIIEFINIDFVYSYLLIIA
jgi:hypothetical protein